MGNRSYDVSFLQQNQRGFGAEVSAQAAPKLCAVNETQAGGAGGVCGVGCWT